MQIVPLTLRMGLSSLIKRLKTYPSPPPPQPYLQVYYYKSSQLDNENDHSLLTAFKALSANELTKT